MLKCPIYNTINACDINSNCLFLRNGGCAIVLSATISEENKKQIMALTQQINNFEYKLDRLIVALRETLSLQM